MTRPRTLEERLFVSVKDGISKDIKRSTISSWLKQTVILAYKNSGVETRALSNVKAHDVRAMAASLAFKGGVSLDQILELSQRCVMEVN